MILDPGRAQTFNVVRVREYLPLGQRVEAFVVDIWKHNGWQEFAAGTSIGSCKLLRAEPVTATKVRVRITQAPVCPASRRWRFSLNESSRVDDVYGRLRQPALRWSLIRHWDGWR